MIFSVSKLLKIIEMDTRIRIIAEDITKDGVNALNRLIELEKELKIETEAANQAQKNSNTETNKSIGIIKSLEDEIQRLIKLRKESTDTTQIAAYNRQIGIQEAELKKLTDTQQKNNNETKNSNTLFSSLAKTMLGLFAVDKLIDYSKQLITLMGDTDKYRIALMNVSTSQKEYEKSIAFLSKLSSDYGQNVNLLTQSYTSFIASSKSSNLTLDARQKIYESIIKAGSALKLSNDGIEGSLRAVSQMFSKGNVSAEELRGQLGERLPGAFGIMAKSMGVSEKELNKMLEQGQVLAKDVLPKFAAELEKLYGDKAQSNLKTIGGAWNVFVNNFIEGLQDFNKSSLFIETISAWILAASNQMKNFIPFVKEAFTIGTEYNKVLNKWYDYYEVLFDAIKKIVGAGWELIKSLGQIVANIIGAGDATLTFKKIVDYMIIGIKALGSVLIGAVTVIQVLADGFNIALNAGEKLANFFGADFKIDPKATFENMANNAETNFKRITDLWNNSSSKVLGTAKNTNKALIEEEKNKTKELEQELGKSVDATKKANKQKLESEVLTNAKIKLEKDKTNKGTREGDLQLLEDQREIDKIKASEKIKNSTALSNQLLLIDTKFNIEKQLINKSYDEKEFNEFKKRSSIIQKEIEKFNLTKINLLEKENKDTLKEKERLNDLIEKELKKSNEIQNDILAERHYDEKIMSAKNAEEIEKIEEAHNLEIAKFNEELTKKILIEARMRLDLMKIAYGEDSVEYKNAKLALLNTENEYNIASLKLSKESMKSLIKIRELSQKEFEQLFEESFQTASNLINQFYEFLDKKSTEAETSAERQSAALNKAFIEPFKENINAAKAIMSGDYLGAAQGIIGYFKGLWDVTIGLKKTLNEIKLNEFNANFEATMTNLSSYSDQIKQNFEGLADASVQFNQTQKTGIDAQIQAEIDRAGKIRETYSLALNKEDELYNKKIKSINDEYDAAIQAINKKYDYISIKASQQYDSESLAITEGVNKDLMAFVTNQDLKLGLTSEYERRRGEIATTFALAYTPIVEGMGQAEIDAINASIKARDEAFAKLADWQTSQIQFVIDNGKLERDTFTETQKIVSDGKEAQYQLSLKYKADEIKNNLDKNTEIENAEKTRNQNIEIETARHNSEIVRLGLEKDAALLNSFNALKDAMKAGYSEILQAAQDAFNRGMITADEYISKLNQINNLRQLIGDFKVDTSTPKNDFTPATNVGFYNEGTEWVGGKKGIDKNPAFLSFNEAVIKGSLNEKRLAAGLNMNKTIDYAINYKSILDSGFQPLQIKSSALDKLEEHKAMQYLINMNVGEIVSELQSVKSTLKSIPIQNFTLDENGLSKYVETKNNVTKFKSKRLK